jgi:restriction endonuclease BamHI
MKWLRTLVIFDRGNVIKSADWRRIHESYVRSIQSIDFPEGSGKLKLRRKTKRPDGQWDRNGVIYLRNRFIQHMTTEEGWQKEFGFKLGKNQTPPTIQLYPSRKPHTEPITSKFGNFDFVTMSGRTHVAIEWETGNISSPHRSMNKLGLAPRFKLES